MDLPVAELQRRVQALQEENEALRALNNVPGGREHTNPFKRGPGMTHSQSQSTVRTKTFSYFLN